MAQMCGSKSHRMPRRRRQDPVSHVAGTSEASFDSRNDVLPSTSMQNLHISEWSGQQVHTSHPYESKQVVLCGSHF